MKSKITVKSLCFISILLVTMVSYITLYNASVLYSCVLAVWCVFFYNVCKDYKTNIVMLCFLISFFIFLLGREFIFEYLDVPRYYIFNDDIEIKTQICLLISLFGLVIGTFIGRRLAPHDRLLRIDNDVVLKNVSKTLYYIFSIPLFIELFINITYIQNTGYINSYESNDSIVRVPLYISMFSGMTPMAFYLFLATKPEKSEAVFPILLYLFYSILTLLTGKRFPFVASLLIIAIYFVLRDSDKDRWLKKKYYYILAGGLPFLIVGLSVFDYVRVGNDIGYKNFIEMFIGFFDQLGGSINVIKRVIFYSDELNPVMIYSFDGLTSLILENGIFKRIFDITVYEGNSAAHALQGHSLAHTLSYLTYGNEYLLGRGVGSCYIAELFHDFGYIGVFLGSILYGWVMKRISTIDFKSPYYIALALAMINSLLLAPRGGFDSFLSRTFGIKELTVIGVVWGIANIWTYLRKS